MTLGTFILIAFGLVAAIIVAIVIASLNEKAKIAAMPPARRNEYVFGPRLPEVICPHCQNKGSVRTKKALRYGTAVSVSNTILKHEYNTTSTTVVNQMHCDNCSMTWDVG